MNIASCEGPKFPPQLLEAVRPHRWVRNFYT
jgi:hypothetical protein